MSDSEADVNGREEPTQTPAAPSSVEAVGPRSAAMGRTLVVCVIMAVAGAWIAANLADRFRVIENVEHGIKAQYMFGGTRLDIRRATQNAAVAYGLVGAILSLILGVTADLSWGVFRYRAF